MRRAVICLVGPALMLLGGCSQRVLLQPVSADAKEVNYIYFVEQENGQASRLKRCEILPDNQAVCTVQFDLK